MERKTKDPDVSIYLVCPIPSWKGLREGVPGHRGWGKGAKVQARCPRVLYELSADAHGV